MADFLLIHGSCHGAWCWRDMLPRLNVRGHTARAIDLPGAGQDATPLAEVTLDLYADAIIAAMTGPTVLVGHSAGGFPISAAAMRRPDLVAHLVYLCAHLPQTGKSMIDRRKDTAHQPLLDAVRKSDDGLSYTVIPEKARAKFYPDCPPEAVAYALAHLCAQPILPQATPLTVTDSLRALPKSYILCQQDGAIPPVFQDALTHEWPEFRVQEMNCGHSPFFAQPARLAEILLQIAEAP
ncbi:MAG: alpha/beta fold hydrolase [Paracoccaceae bacterium]